MKWQNASIIVYTWNFVCTFFTNLTYTAVVSAMIGTIVNTSAVSFALIMNRKIKYPIMRDTLRISQERFNVSAVWTLVQSEESLDVNSPVFVPSNHAISCANIAAKTSFLITWYRVIMEELIINYSNTTHLCDKDIYPLLNTILQRNSLSEYTNTVLDVW